MDLDDPANCLTFALSRAARSLVRGFEEAARATGLSAPQFSTLWALSALGEASIGRLAERLGTERTTLTRNLDLLQRQGLIAPVASADGRVRAYALSQAGRDRLAEAWPAWSAWQRRHVERLGEDGAMRLLEALGTF